VDFLYCSLSDESFKVFTNCIVKQVIFAPVTCFSCASSKAGAMFTFAVWYRFMSMSLAHCTGEVYLLSSKMHYSIIAKDRFMVLLQPVKMKSNESEN
jgi:hypothetical protein